MLEWLGNTPYALWILESIYGWAIMLTIHAFGNAIVVGTIVIVALRLSGTFRPLPYTLMRRLIPLIWIGVVVQAFSGFSLFLTKPVRYLGDGLFQWKLGLVVAGIVATIYLQSLLKREAAGWEETNSVSTNGLRLATIAGLIWAGVLIMGRLTAYVGQLYHA